jgi:membrane protease YdiL (CAAX protease family)
VRKTWTVADFALIWLGGAILSAVVVAALVAPGASLGRFAVAGLAAQYAGILLVLGVLWFTKGRPSIGMQVEPGDLRYVVAGMLLYIVTAILLQPLARLFYPEGRPPQEITEAITSPSTSSGVRLTLVVAAIVFAPLTEELMYRGVLFQAMRRRGPWVAIMVTALVFTLVHVVGLDPNNRLGSAAVVLPPLFGLGILLGWLTERKGRIGPALFLHSGWNMLVALILLVPADLLETMALIR